ncbi:MFS transporter [Listeria grandensis]|uniref:MFS transporter n=1 Tax=Listeria grandensis TaxID=1494963 RepID=A0A7X0Y5A3_9LIST|nr:glycoside-pentoside-hexuronide (GPH):cation symporter [Listeria grandensis]MBC1937235.1 MFS transporter [Listeria grandensis]
MYVGELMKRRKLSMKEKLSYGMGDFASNLVYQGISIFILFYWTDYAGISAAVAGTILLISRIFDGVIDVVFGNLVDKTKSKYGKARPYLLWLALPFAFSAMITFWTPGTNGIADIIFAFVSYNVTMVIYTAINIPYGVLSVKMTDDQVERGSLGVFRGIGALIGSMLVAIIAPMLIGVVGYTWTFLIIGLVAAASLLVTFKGTEEHVGLTQEDKVTPFKEGFVALLKNKPWLIMLLVGILVFTFSGLKMTSNIYMAKYYFGDESLVGILNVMMMPGMLIGMGVATLLFRRFGKIKTTVFGNLIMFLATVAFYFIFQSPDDLVLFYGFLVLNGAFLGIGTAGFFAMIADTIEYGEWKTKKRIEGLTYSAASVGTKIGGGVGAALVGWLLALVHYNGTLATQPEAVSSMIVWINLWIPGMICLIVAIVLSFNKVDKLYPQIMQDLDARKGVKEV